MGVRRTTRLLVFEATVLLIFRLLSIDDRVRVGVRPKLPNLALGVFCVSCLLFLSITILTFYRREESDSET